MAGSRRPELPATPEDRRARRLRWAVALLLVLGVHALVLFGLVRMPGPLIPFDPAETPALQAILLPPPVVTPPPRPAPARPARKRAPEPAPAEPAPAPAQEPQPTPGPPIATSPNGAQAVAPNGGAPAGTAEGSGSVPGGAPAAPSPEPPLRYAPPPSATLQYASFVNGVQNPDGLIRWQQGGGRYRLSVETRVLWFRFAFHSDGALGEQGLAPERYVEQRRKRSQSTRFDRASGAIVFESTGRQVALPNGAQDRFSVFLQLVGLVRGNPQRYATPGVTESFEVADTSDLEPMRVQYVGDVDVDTGNGFVRAKHFVRLPRRADDRRRVEVWLAESKGWMPVKLRQTEPDGTQIDLVLRAAQP